MKLTEIEAVPRVLILGESGKGKTRLLGTFAQTMKTVMVTADRSGLDTLRATEFKTEPEILLAEDWADPWALVAQLHELAKSGYTVCAVDDLGSLQKVIARKLQGNARGRDEERKNLPALTMDVRRALLRGERRLMLAQWGEMDIALNSFLAEIFQAPFGLFVVTVLETSRDHPRTGETQVYAALQGGIREELAARFSLVVNLFDATLKNGAHVFVGSCRPHPRLPNKTRYGEPRTWFDLSAQKVIAHIYGKEDADARETIDERTVGSGDIKD